MLSSASLSKRRSIAKENKAQIFAGVDIGGTSIKIGLIDGEGTSLASDVIFTAPERGPENACINIAEALGRLIDRVSGPIDQIARIGLAMPGALDIAGGQLVCAGNLPGWEKFPIRERLSQRTGRMVSFVNDANAAAYGEYWCGAGENYDSIVLLTLGTGIGGGIIVGGTLVGGKHNCGSECGHILIDHRNDARRDALGNRGSLEAYSSARAVVERTLELLESGLLSSIAERRAAGEEITPRIIAEEAERGDALAYRIVMDTAHYLAIGIVSLIHAIDPEIVLLGGSMNFGGDENSVGEAFIQKLREDVRDRLLAPLRDQIPIRFAALGGSAGYIGAAALARIDFLRYDELEHVATH